LPVTCDPFPSSEGISSRFGSTLTPHSLVQGLASLHLRAFSEPAPFNAPPFGPRTPAEYLFLQPRSYFGQQIPQHTLPFESGLITAPRHLRSTTARIKVLAQALGLLWARPMESSPRPDADAWVALRHRFLPNGIGRSGPWKDAPDQLRNVQPRVGLAYSFRVEKASPECR